MADMRKHLLGAGVRQAVRDFCAVHGLTCTILDASGSVVLQEGEPGQDDKATSAAVRLRRKPTDFLVECRGKACSSDHGEKLSGFLAGILGAMVEFEIDIESLSEEVAERYEEVNLLYDISQKAGALLDEKRICRLVLQELVRVLELSAGIVILVEEGSGNLVRVCEVGCSKRPQKTEANASRTLKRIISEGRERRLSPEEAGGEPLLAGLPEGAVGCFPMVRNVGDEDVEVVGLVALPKPGERYFTSGESKLAVSVALQAGVSVGNCRFIRAQQELQRVAGELAIAAQIQSDLLPRDPLVGDGYSVRGSCRPARTVGGDYYDFFEIEPGRVAVVVADVCGHSLGAALMASAFRTSLRVEARRKLPVRELMSGLNRLLYDDLVRAELLIGFTYFEYSASTGMLSMGNAGHTQPLLYRQGREPEELGAEGLLLGVKADADFEQLDVRVEPGSTVLLYTDGVVESENLQNQLFGTRRLKELFQRLAASMTLDTIIETIINATELHAGSQEQSDDKTVVLFSTGPGDEGPAGAQAEQAR